MNRKEWIEAVKARADILEEIGARIELKKSGENYLGRCPYHDDVNPSLVVTPGKRLWNCLGCPGGANGRTGGSVIDFIMRFENLSFMEAAKKLGEKYGLPWQNGNGHRPHAVPAKSVPVEAKREVSIERRKQLLGRAMEVYHREYLACEAARAYVEKERAVLGSLAAKHRIGYSPGGVLAKLVPESGDVRAEVVALGLLNQRGGERFTGRIVFGLVDAEGDVVGMVGRAIASEPRYMALPDPFLGIFNRTGLTSADWVVLVEGVFDALAVESIGYANVVPLCGKMLRDELVSAIRLAGVRQVVVLLDAGEAEASKRIAERLGRDVPGLDVRVAALEEGDPNSAVAGGEAEVLRRVIEDARKDPAAETPTPAPAAPATANPGEVLIEVVCESRRYVVEAIEQKNLHHLRVLVRAWSGPRFLLHTFNIKSLKERKPYEKDVALFYKVEYGVVRGDMDRVLERVEAFVTSRGAEATAPKAIPGEVRQEAIALGRSADIFTEVLADVATLGVVGEEANVLAMYLLVTSRKMADPLCILFLSGSGSGKSLVQDRVLSLCPPDDLKMVTALTGRSLFYGEKSLRGKVLAIREESGAEDAAYAIRALISDKELVIEATIKDPVTGRMTTMTNRVDGSPAVSLTSANSKTDPETLSRFMVRAIDESAEQTERILESQREGETLSGLIGRKERERIVEKHRAFQKLLEPVEVVNPYATRLTYPVRSLRARRSQPMYLAILRTVAFLNQMKKERKTASTARGVVEYIEVDLADIRAAHRLAKELLGGTLEDLSSVGRELLELVHGMVQKRAADQGVGPDEILFSKRDVREGTGKSEYHVRTYLDELARLEYVLPVSRGARGVTQYRLDYREGGERPDPFVLGLVEPDELEKGLREGS